MSDLQEEDDSENVSSFPKAALAKANRNQCTKKKIGRNTKFCASSRTPQRACENTDWFLAGSRIRNVAN